MSTQLAEFEFFHKLSVTLLAFRIGFSFSLGKHVSEAFFFPPTKAKETAIKD